MSAPPPSPKLHELLGAKPAGLFRYGPDKPLVVLRSHWPIDRALKVLLKHNITAAPLLCRVHAGGEDSWEIGGVVDVMDLAKLALETARREGHLEDLLGSEELATLTEEAPPSETVTPLLRSPSSDEPDSIAAAANVSCNNPTCTVGATQSLLHALPLLASRVRRALITDPAAGCIGVLSQSDILRTVVEDLDAMDEVSQTLLSDVVKPRGLLTCNPTTPAAVAFKTMLDANVSALAMVNDDTDTIVGNFSVSDIRTLGVAPRTSWGDLLRGPAIDFIRAARETAVAGGGAVFRDAAGVAVERVISVRPTDVLGTAMNMMMATRMHRVWVVDRKTGRPTGLLSIADVLQVLKERLYPDGVPEGEGGGEGAAPGSP